MAGSSSEKDKWSTDRFSASLGFYRISLSLFVVKMPVRLDHKELFATNGVSAVTPRGIKIRMSGKPG
ncbi:hypothetical protein V1264_009366 [Littorina saxatilis]|uniref:Uncharacterized protein n=1 Tax=Littorina saxatilis TaxID=31220 RepID=A0AAN9AS64_9CAEN